MHEEDEIFGVWAPDLFRDDPWMALGQLGLFSVAVAGFSYFIYKTHPARPAVCILLSLLHAASLAVCRISCVTIVLYGLTL